MFKEFVEAISEMAVKAARHHVSRPDAEPGHVYLVDGILTEAEPQPRKHIASDLKAIIDFANDNTSAVVWYSRVAVVCLTDDTTRRDRVTLPLTFSPQLAGIIAMGAGKAFKQAALILLLRSTFARCMGPSPNLLQALRTLKFRVNSEGNADLQHGKSSVGRSIQQEVSGPNALPETFILDVPIFDGIFPSIVGRVEIALEPDAGTETLALVPLAGEVERVLRQAEEQIKGFLDGELGSETRTYFGKPE